MSTVRTHALAYRIWAYADPLGWNCTMREVADEMGVGLGSVRNIAASKAWTDRFRANNESAIKAAIFFSSRSGGGLPRDIITPADYRARAELDE